jgi:hypothetical protein
MRVTRWDRGGQGAERRARGAGHVARGAERRARGAGHVARGAGRGAIGVARTAGVVCVEHELQSLLPAGEGGPFDSRFALAQGKLRPDEGRAARRGNISMVTAVALAFLFAFTAAAAEVHINGDQPLYVDRVPFTVTGTTDQPPGTAVTALLGGRSAAGAVDLDKAWSVAFDGPLATGTYELRVTIGEATAVQLVRAQIPENLWRQSPFAIEPVYSTVAPPAPDTVQEMTDRWRIVPPPYELDESPRARRIGSRGATLDPYNKNLLKGDYPIFGRDTFLVLSGISDTLAESRTVPTPSGVGSVRPSSFHFFGNDNQNLFEQNLILSADLYQGDTTFQPVRQRLKITVIENLNHVAVEENGLVKPDVRRGTSRTNGYFALQEIFYERKLRNLSPNYDFISVRVGSQPFSSDFRGFVFTDTNLGARLFGNYASNRYQYNLAFFDRFEKDTDSGLNRIGELRDQQVAVANFYAQDFLRKGYTQEFSIHQLHDGGPVSYDRNGNLVRPAPIGSVTPHKIDATYIGEAGLGHFGRVNVDQAVYYVFGHDSQNPIAGPDPRLRDGNSVRIGAAMAALDLSVDRDWYRPHVGLFYASGDRNPRDRKARGFDSIDDSPDFAGGGFSFFNRLAIRLPDTGVVLVDRGSLIPSLRSSKDEGQPNYVNPGLQLLTAGVDFDVTPRLKALLNVNAIRLDAPQAVEAVLFQGSIHKALGTDLSIGARYRPFLSNNWIIVGGVAAFIPGRGFEDIYEKTGTLYHVFTSVSLSF